jgi:hypothetical protein
MKKDLEKKKKQKVAVDKDQLQLKARLGKNKQTTRVFNWQLRQIEVQRANDCLIKKIEDI